MKKTTIYFLRHGEVHNPDDILYGRLPKFGLSDRGMKHIESVARELRDKHIDYLYTSPLLRTRQTAKVIGCVLHVEPRISRRLLEVKLIFAGISLTEYREKIQPILYDEIHIKKGQESVEDIVKRMLQFLHMITKRHSGKTILAVSHGDPIMILRAYLSGTPFTFLYKKVNYLQTGTYIRVIYTHGQYTVD